MKPLATEATRSFERASILPHEESCRLGPGSRLQCSLYRFERAVKLT